MADLKWGTPASIATWMSTDLNSLANGARVVGSAVDNSTGDYFFADIEAVLAFGTAPTAGNVVELYLLPSVDGTNYPDDAYADLPPALWVCSFRLRNNTANRTAVRGIIVPIGLFKPVLKNLSGQALASSGSTIKAVLYSTASV